MTYLNPLSTDAFGQTLADRLTQAGVMQTAERSTKPTSLAIIHMRQGQPSYGFYRDGVADRDYAADDLVRRMKAQTPGVLHTGSLMAMPPEHRKVMHVIQFAKALGWTISIDVNLRTQVADDLPAYLQAVTEMAALADWLMHDTLGHDDAAAQRIEKTLQRALKAAAINCEREGCQPPSLDELETALT